MAAFWKRDFRSVCPACLCGLSVCTFGCFPFLFFGQGLCGVALTSHGSHRLFKL